MLKMLMLRCVGRRDGREERVGVFGRSSTRLQTPANAKPSTTPRQQLSPEEVNAALGCAETEVNCAVDTFASKHEDAITSHPR